MVFLVLFVLWPLVELAAFILVAQWIGVFNALGLLVLISIAGVWLAKHEGVGTLARMRGELNAGRVPSGPLVDGGLLAAAGLLLVVPGFVTDLFALALLVPPIRRLAGRGVSRRYAHRRSRGLYVRSRIVRIRSDRSPPYDAPELPPAGGAEPPAAD